MTDWTSGYVADIDYTYGYYLELNPTRTNLAFLNKGIARPKKIETACELGFGQGMSVNFHAAGSNTEWWGTDFNPMQAAFARDLAQVSGANAHLYDEAFEDFCNRSDIPEFDYIGLHGIWSWISEKNRQLIVDFVRRKLKVGGILYVSYNTLPGWASFAPMRHLMTRHSEVIGSAGVGIISRIDGALEFADKLLQTEPGYLKANEPIKERLNKLKKQNRHYLAHEYFNKDWHPMHFATMADWMSQAKMSYACSTEYLDHIDAVNLTQEQQDFMKEIPDLMLRQSVRDFMVNMQFRRDYWVKGARNIPMLDRVEAIQQERVIMINQPADIPMKVKTTQGEAVLNAEIYEPIIDVLSSFQVVSVGELLAQCRSKGLELGQIAQALLVLGSQAHLISAQDDDTSKQAMGKCNTLNDYLIKKSRSDAQIINLVSPITGGGIPVGRFQQLFILSMQSGLKTPEEWAKNVWDILKQQGERVAKDGQALMTDEENIDELKERAMKFEKKQLPILRALKIVNI